MGNVTFLFRDTILSVPFFFFFSSCSCSSSSSCSCSFFFLLLATQTLLERIKHLFLPQYPAAGKRVVPTVGLNGELAPLAWLGLGSLVCG